MKAPAMRCRVCGSPVAAPAFDDPGPSLSSIRTVLPVPTRVYLCASCGHAQSPDLPDLKEFYDTQYRISLDIDGHDQLYENKAGAQVFRTDYQAELVLAADVPQGARVLDFGAGKATTLQKILAARPDIDPHVFDVSRDYVTHWNAWVAPDNQATYDLPAAWTGRFDLVTAHFVVEHVAEPVDVLSDIARCLAPGGRVFLTVPDAEGNTGDLLVVDHLNHFSQGSLEAALHAAGLRAQSIDRDAFHGAFLVMATAGEAAPAAPRDTGFADVLAQWRAMLDRVAGATLSGPVAIYGAGFYGSVIRTRLADDPVCFLDRNPYLQGQEHLGVPVRAPEDCPPETTTIIAGLNPGRARALLGQNTEWMPAGAELFFLDG